eukprot:TRINITY_DN12502_c0_g2_i1.p1 TRINITY_DN12502_c0_g2~~TRINITY_DN12502_c0_g2_i1.p1  ORF type:complete len:558 (-),score=156.00 TRINITY_DN12502_c0_g2_i1:65-1696(-)
MTDNFSSVVHPQESPVTLTVNPDYERLQSTQASRLQEIRFIEEEKRRIQSKIQALALVKQQQDNTVVQDSTSFVKKRKKRRKKTRAKEDGEQSNIPESPDVDIEYVSEPILTPRDPLFYTYHKIFQHFKLPDPRIQETAVPQPEVKKHEIARDVMIEEDSDDDMDKEKPKLSKKKIRKMNRLTVAELKQLVERPDVVEMHDVTAQDPRLLVYLKSYRNTVPVPRHWCFKRKYLQGKRGIEKPPFDLPSFIKATGIQEMRQVLNEKDDMKSLKSKQREKVRPKLGKMTIEYQKLHDAFFKWQTKPYMTIHGDLYYEGKEFETQLREKKPGEMSDELRQALSMPLGQDKHKCPPPWLIAMQRYGPPPSYPNLKIPGLNAPIPEGALFGYHLGGWGKPPVDEYGRALYGDVFGTQQQHMGEDKGDDEDIDKTLWGELESEDESTDESDDASEPEIAKPPLPEDPGIRTPAGFATPSGLTSIPRGIETPGSLELRKRTVEDGHEGGETPSLYTLIPEKQTSAGTFLTTHTYDLSGVSIVVSVYVVCC